MNSCNNVHSAFEAEPLGPMIPGLNFGYLIRTVVRSFVGVSVVLQKELVTET